MSAPNPRIEAGDLPGETDADIGMSDGEFASWLYAKTCRPRYGCEGDAHVKVSDDARSLKITEGDHIGGYAALFWADSDDVGSTVNFALGDDDASGLDVFTWGEINRERAQTIVTWLDGRFPGLAASVHANGARAATENPDA